MQISFKKINQYLIFNIENGASCTLLSKTQFSPLKTADQTISDLVNFTTTKQ